MPVDVHSKNQAAKGQGVLNDDNIGYLEEEKRNEDVNREYVSEDGSVYKGEKLNNERHGQGTLTWPDGSVYTGNWK